MATGDKLVNLDELKLVYDSSLRKADIVNNVITSDSQKPLSAAAGKFLNDTYNSIIGSKSSLSYVSKENIVAAINSLVGWFQNSNYKFVTGYVSPASNSTVVQQIQAAINDITTDSKPVQFMYHVYCNYHCTVLGVLYAGKNYGCGLYFKPDGTLEYWLLSNNAITTKKDLTEEDVVNNLTSTSNTVPLSAAQGKALNDTIVAKTSWKTFLSESNVSVGDTYASTGKSFTLTKFSLVVVSMSYGSGRPLALGLKNSESAGSGSVALVSVVGSDISDTSGLSVTALLPIGTYYIWARTASATGSSSFAVQGVEIGA